MLERLSNCCLFKFRLNKEKKFLIWSQKGWPNSYVNAMICTRRTSSQDYSTLYIPFWLPCGTELFPPNPLALWLCFTSQCSSSYKGKLTINYIWFVISFFNNKKNRTQSICISNPTLATYPPLCLSWFKKCLEEKLLILEKFSIGGPGLSLSRLLSLG